MWSSPLLLLVLVFTLTSRPLHPSTTTSTTPRPVVTLPHEATPTTITTVSPSTTTSTTLVVPTTRGPARVDTSPATRRTTNRVAVTKTAARSAPSSGVIATSVVANANARRVDLRGALSLNSPAALVPLSGPNQWTLVATHRVTSTLLCGSRSSAVDTTVRVSRNQTCQLDITVATGAPTAWTLRLVQ